GDPGRPFRRGAQGHAHAPHPQPAALPPPGRAPVARRLTGSACWRPTYRGDETMQRVLLTGAAGDIGGRLRKLLKPVYAELRLSDIKKPADLRPDEPFVAADLARIEEVEKAVEGMEGVIHLGGHSVEGPWETILQANIIGCYNLFEAAR